MGKTRLTRSGCYRWQWKIFISNTFQDDEYQARQKSEALLKEMLKKNSRYGSVHAIANEAVRFFYASERKKGFR